MPDLAELAALAQLASTAVLAARAVFVPILRQGDCLIISVLSTLTDSELLALRDRIVERAMAERSRGVVLDVTGLDVIDSFTVHTLSSMAQMLALRGAETVIVGIRPDVAYAMVQLRLRLTNVRTALDLDEGLHLLRLRRSNGS